MPLFEMTAEDLVYVPSSTFAVEWILERADLQRLLCARIDAIVDDVLIVSEEFGAFADARRRIDLLGIDREGHLVVFELKRTSGGGHLELQALRYAAMISTMTFDDLAGHYEQYLARVEPDAADEAHARLAEWLDDGDAAKLSRLVRIVLISGGFDREITTTVLWLTEMYGLDIRCVRLTPYKVGERLLLDVQQVIPLPEASELTIQLQRKATQERAAGSVDGRDWTPYIITGAEGGSQPLRKIRRPGHGPRIARGKRARSGACRGYRARQVPLGGRHAYRRGPEGSIRRRVPEGERSAWSLVPGLAHS